MSTRTILTVCAVSTVTLGIVLVVAGAPGWVGHALLLLTIVTAVGALAAPRDETGRSTS